MKRSKTPQDAPGGSNVPEPERPLETAPRPSVGPKKAIARKLPYRKRYPERIKAHYQVNQAIKTGLIVRKPCEVCGAIAQAHHDDYSKPLEVRWLCAKHHSRHHWKLGEDAPLAKCVRKPLGKAERFPPLKRKQKPNFEAARDWRKMFRNKSTTQ